MNDSGSLITGINFSRLVQERLGATTVLKPSVTGAGLLYQFEGLPSGGRLPAVVAVYTSETLAKSAVQEQITRTSVSPTKREPTADGELVLWEVANPMFGSMMLRHKNVVIRLLNGMSWGNRLVLLTYIDQALGLKNQDVSKGARVVPPEIGEIKLPQSVPAGESVQAPIEVKNIDAATALLGSDNTSVSFRFGDKPVLTYRTDKPGTATVVLIIASPGNVISKREMTVNVR